MSYTYKGAIPSQLGKIHMQLVKNEPKTRYSVYLCIDTMLIVYICASCTCLTQIMNATALECFDAIVIHMQLSSFISKATT